MFDSSWLWLTYSFILGACLGSFANVVIYRLPKGESVVKPRSRCYSCGKSLEWKYNIPIFAWILLRGKCGYCKVPFSIRYPLVELLMAVLFSLVYFYSPDPITMIEYWIFVFGLVTCSFIDFDHMILPNEFTLSGIVIGVVGSLLNPNRDVASSLLGVLAGGGSLWLTAYAYFIVTKQDGMGGGDIKLLAWIGAILGWRSIPFVIMSSAIIGSVIGLIVARRTKTGLKTVIPFGPYLALGAILYMFGGEAFANWYLELFLPSL